MLGGVREEETEDQRAEHVRAMLAVQDDMGYLAKDISEIDAADPDTIRIVAKVNNRALQLTLGDSNFARRYQNFLNHYPEIEKHSPQVKSFDLRLDDSILRQRNEEIGNGSKTHLRSWTRCRQPANARGHLRP